jgi:hypothetical protein
MELAGMPALDRRRRAEALTRRVTLLLALALALGGAGPALAWGEKGHRVIAEIAMANVSPRTAAAVAGLLRAEAGLDTPACPVKSLSDAAVWPDCLRGDRERWGYTFAWHYQDGPVCAASFDPNAHCPGGNCVTAQIERDRRLLADRGLPPAQRLEALAFLAHFVGDVHMPLHAADNDDRGGNSVRASWPGRPEGDLHALWDGPMAERAIATAHPPLVRVYPPAERARIATGEAGDWARESWQLARRFVYPQAFGHSPCGGRPPAHVDITAAQIEAGAPIARQRLLQARLRLARLLDAALGH